MTLNFKLFNTGFCTSLEKLAIKTAPWRRHKFPATFALIQHPKFGNILFDSGHSSRFFKLTNKFPLSVYRWLIHVTHDEKQDAINQLKTFGLSPKEINYIFISHFHADHIGGLCDFPNAKFIYLKNAYEAVKNLKRLSALKAGFISGLIPNDFVQRSYLLDNQPMISLAQEYFPFESGYQIFNDDSLMAVKLPGHTEEQVGLFLKISENEKIFMIGDACWSSESYLNLVLPHSLSFIAMAGKETYMETLKKIHHLNKHSPDIKIIPSHCQQVWEKFEGQDYAKIVNHH